ncbi:hypothetical protein TSOC_001211 [Tetrabaena socialis]|uniref:Cilia-and flagella-associated protein 96 n=1 Tax=Tetrabaena socialis TaxID=47790 RepID=A0A2J8AHA1_9CHLO|nr:hypothetical protein TSOC_001211 [Tetrabaena socialis]|eukprot:PNH11892.1 hypothetical protein TSOC_001211 [Tetrabaena socialis]
MTTKYGMFKEHVYLTPADPPPGGESTVEASGGGQGSFTASGGATVAEPRDHGLNFKATVGRVGKGNDASFGAFKSLYQGDKYVDPSRRALQAQNELRKKQVGPAPFKAASPMKHSTTPGDFVGTIEGKVEYVPGRTFAVQKKREDIKGEPKGFYTSPAKKGTFGYNKTTLSERTGYQGVATEYEYQHDPEELQRQRRVQEREADHAARQAPPFRPANPPKRGGAGVPNTTISKGKGVAGEYEYVVGSDPSVAPRDPNNPTASPAKAAGAEGDKPEGGPAFRPASLNPRHLGRQPEYLHDPEAPRLDAEHARKKAESQRLANAGQWRPNDAKKTDMVRSIVRMNLK